MSVKNTVFYRLIVLAIILLFAVQIATAAPTFSIYASSGPDPVGSYATYQAYASNALYALQNGLGAYGDPNSPAYYSQLSSYSTTDAISSDGAYSLWKGQINPPGAYAGQTGNYLFFGLVLNGNGEQFTYGDVTMVQDFFGDPVGPYTLEPKAFSGGYALGYDSLTKTTYDFSNVPDAGAAMDKLWYVGIGGAWIVRDPTTLAGYIDSIALAPAQSSAVTYTATLGGSAYNGYASVDVVPEPATVALTGLGLLAVGFAARRRTK